jgi:hypothetical protein
VLCGSRSSSILFFLVSQLAVIPVGACCTPSACRLRQYTSYFATTRSTRTIFHGRHHWGIRGGLLAAQAGLVSVQQLDSGALNRLLQIGNVEWLGNGLNRERMQQAL